MITIKEFLEVSKYKITNGSEYQWRLFGNNVRWLDSECDDYSMSIVYDSVTQEVYVAEVYATNKAYRLVNPKYVKAHKKEYASRGIPYTQATDEFDFIDLETDKDWIEKASAIAEGKEYDTRIEVPITLPDDEMFQLMKIAHEHDLTLNQMVEKILRLMIAKEQFND